MIIPHQFEPQTINDAGVIQPKKNIAKKGKGFYICDECKTEYAKNQYREFIVHLDFCVVDALAQIITNPTVKRKKTPFFSHAKEETFDAVSACFLTFKVGDGT